MTFISQHIFSPVIWFFPAFWDLHLRMSLHESGLRFQPGLNVTAGEIFSVYMIKLIRFENEHDLRFVSVYMHLG